MSRGQSDYEEENSHSCAGITIRRAICIEGLEMRRTMLITAMEA